MRFCIVCLEPGPIGSKVICEKCYIEMDPKIKYEDAVFLMCIWDDMLR